MVKKILAGVAVSLALVVGGCVWWLVRVTGEPVKVVRAHLEAINAGDYARAYSYFSTETKSKMSLEEFNAVVEKNSEIYKTRDSTFTSRNIKNNVATIEGVLTGRDGRAIPVRFTLVKEGDRWLIRAVRVLDRFTILGSLVDGLSGPRWNLYGTSSMHRSPLFGTVLYTVDFSWTSAKL